MIAIIIGAVAVGMIFVIGILAAIMLPALSRAREAARRASCANNLKQMGIVHKMFANQDQGEYFPKLSIEPGRLMFPLLSSPGSDSVYPEYLTDLRVIMCPGEEETSSAEQSGAAQDPNWAIDDNSYLYLGYAVINDAEMAAFAQAYQAHLANGGAFLEDLPVPAGTGSAGHERIMRLREGIERFIITEIIHPGSSTAAPMQSSIPVMIERPDNYIPTGGNVLFMDGHVEYLKYPDKWPMTEQTIDILYSLDALGQ